MTLFRPEGIAGLPMPRCLSNGLRGRTGFARGFFFRERLSIFLLYRQIRPWFSVSSERSQGAGLEFEFEAEQPIEVKFFRGEPLFELLA